MQPSFDSCFSTVSQQWFHNLLRLEATQLRLAACTRIHAKHTCNVVSDNITVDLFCKTTTYDLNITIRVSCLAIFSPSAFIWKMPLTKVQNIIIFIVTAFKKAEQTIVFYLCCDTKERSEIKHAHFQTHGRGVPKPNHHGLLALLGETIMCSWFSAAL